MKKPKILPEHLLQKRRLILKANDQILKYHAIPILREGFCLCQKTRLLGKEQSNLVGLLPAVWPTDKTAARAADAAGSCQVATKAQTVPSTSGDLTQEDRSGSFFYKRTLSISHVICPWFWGWPKAAGLLPHKNILFRTNPPSIGTLSGTLFSAFGTSDTSGTFGAVFCHKIG